jgi:hypothetical protein
MRKAAPGFKGGLPKSRVLRPSAIPDRGTVYFLVPSPAKRLLNFATWPPVSIMR